MIPRGQLSGWNDVVGLNPPPEDLYRAGLWLMARHPRLSRLAARITGVVEVEDDGPIVDLHHLTEVVAAEPRYQAAWRAYEQSHRAPKGDDEWERWRADGPQPDEFAVGLSDLLVMSSGELASIRLLAAFGGEASFRTDQLRSLDAEGSRLLADWCRALQCVYGADSARPFGGSQRARAVMPADSIPYWPVEPPER